MRLLAFTDLHGPTKHLAALAAKAAEPEVDALLCAGDFTQFGAHAPPVLERLAASGLPLYAVPGNHEDDRLLAAARGRFPLLENVNGRWRELDGVWICGFGGPAPFRRTMPQDAGEPYPEILALWKNLPLAVKERRAPAVLLSHYPPLDTVLDEPSPGRHDGSEQVRKFIEALQPAVAICGHMHRAFGREGRMGPTRLVNPGPAGMVIDISLP
jgi:Icc-related predicted phosphoesterase